MKNNNYNPKLRQNANTLRQTMTKAEACLWKYALRAGNMKGYTFRRQRPVLNYIVDFICLDLKLVIEVDGYTHLLEETAEKDEFKQKSLENEGYLVIRFTDNEVLTGIKQIINLIEQYMVHQEIKFNLPCREKLFR